MATATKRVGGSKAPASAGDKEKRPRQKREKVPYPIESAPEGLVQDGKLTGFPENFNPREHRKPGKDAFIDDPAAMIFRAGLMRQRAQAQLDRANKMIERAENIRKFGDPEKQRKAKKAARLREQLQSLLNELGEEGVDVSSLQ